MIVPCYWIPIRGEKLSEHPWERVIHWSGWRGSYRPGRSRGYLSAKSASRNLT